MACLNQAQNDLTEYRKYASSLKKVALWPKQLSEAEIQAIKDKAAAELKAF